MNREVGVIIEPGMVRQWEGFCEIAKPGSFALDGYVYGPPRSDFRKKRFNRNHHEGVDRGSTRCTSMQLSMDFHTGLLEMLPKHLWAYVNDPDEDTSLAVAVLRNPELVFMPCMSRIMQIEDYLDTTAGSYSLSSLQYRVLEELAWMYEPYRAARTSGMLDTATDKAQFYRMIIDMVCERINRFALGRGELGKLDFDYKVIGGGPDWTFVRDMGADARIKMFGQDRIKAYIAVRPLPNGRYDYKIARQSICVEGFPVPEIKTYLNEREQCPPEASWGGSDIIIGSPRVIGSRFTPPEVEAMANEIVVPWRESLLQEQVD